VASLFPRVTRGEICPASGGRRAEGASLRKPSPSWRATAPHTPTRLSGSRGEVCGTARIVRPPARRCAVAAGGFDTVWFGGVSVGVWWWVPRNLCCCLPDQIWRDGLNSGNRCPLRFVQGDPPMMPSNSTAKIQSRRDRACGGDGGHATAPRVQAYAQSGIRHPAQFCAQSGSRQGEHKSPTCLLRYNAGFYARSGIRYKRRLGRRCARHQASETISRTASK
jgi:hypothetical protein